MQPLSISTFGAVAARPLKFKIPIDAILIKYITRMIMTRELNLYFAKLRKEDELISFERLDLFSEDEIDAMCFMRGIDITDLPLQKKVKDLKLWLSISNLRNVPHSLLLYSRIEDYAADMFEISEDEDEYEVLRRVSLWV